MPLFPLYQQGSVGDIHEANKNGFSNGKQFELPRPQGNCWFELSIAKKSFPSSTDPAFTVLSRDITERKQADAELEKHHRHLEALVKARTAELETKNAELQRFNKLFVDRELRMAEFKEVIKTLKERG